MRRAAASHNSDLCDEEPLLHVGGGLSLSIAPLLPKRLPEFDGREDYQNKCQKLCPSNHTPPPSARREAAHRLPLAALYYRAVAAGRAVRLRSARARGFAGNRTEPLSSLGYPSPLGSVVNGGWAWWRQGGGSRRCCGYGFSSDLPQFRTMGCAFPVAMGQ